MPASPLVDCVRINQRTYGWTSCAFTVDGMPTEGLVGLDFDEKLETRTVLSNKQDGAPLGMSLGRYQIGTFPVRMLRDSARVFKQYLQTKALTVASTSYGQAVFALGLQLAASDAGDLQPMTTAFGGCRVLGEKTANQRGIDALVTEFQVGCLIIEQDGNTLWNATPTLVGGFPAADTITVAGLPAPGKWTLTKADKEYGWQILQATAMTGATIKPIGDPLVTADFNVEFWDPLDYAAFKLFRKQFLMKALVTVPGSPVGLTLAFDHPELSDLGLSQFAVKKITPVLNDGYGVWSCKVEFLQYRKPAPALSKPNASIPDNGEPRPTAKTALEIQLQQQLAQMQAAANRAPH
jgi:hypothetical protein